MAAEAFKKFGVCVFAITIPEVEELEQDKESGLSLRLSLSPIRSRPRARPK